MECLPKPLQWKGFQMHKGHLKQVALLISFFLFFRAGFTQRRKEILSAQTLFPSSSAVKTKDSTKGMIESLKYHQIYLTTNYEPPTTNRLLRQRNSHLHTSPCIRYRRCRCNLWNDAVLLEIEFQVDAVVHHVINAWCNANHLLS